ncbi:hypothetical protein QQF64_000152 [Cirrhinus molitorella]
MILNAEYQHLDVSAKLTLAGKDYTIFISTESMKCFSCGVYGHTKLKCTNNKVIEQNETETETETPSVREAPALVNGDQDGSDKTDQRDEMDSLSKDAENPNKDAAISHTENAAKCSVNANACTHVHSAASGGSETVAVGNSDSLPGKPGELVGVGVLRDSQAPFDPLQADVDQLSERGESQSMDKSSDSEESDVGDYFTDVSSQGSVAEKKCSSQMKPPFYTVQQINDFLNDTFNQRRPKLEQYFTDLQLFVDSCAMIMRKASLEELDQPKRYRLKKHVSAVKKRLISCRKKH